MQRARMTTLLSQNRVSSNMIRGSSNEVFPTFRDLLKFVKIKGILYEEKHTLCHFLECTSLYSYQIKLPTVIGTNSFR
jgi:hypothetical protein